MGHLRTRAPVGLLLLSAALLLFASHAVGASLDRHSCTVAVEEWSEAEQGKAEELKWQLQERDDASGNLPDLPELLFFLHIPRAGGKSYHQCFLFALMPAALQCNMSYHVLRDDPSHACRLLATHDDYSMTARLPPGTRTVITSLFRDPVQRVISSYEFAAHIAARSMGLEVHNHPDDTVMGARRKIRDHYTNLVNTDTRNIWPWTVLSIAMEEDLWHRRDFVGIPPDPPGFDPQTAHMYDRPHLILPLREFIQLPLVHDIVHNGAVFQIAGITNNSIIPEATRLRHCIIKYPELGQHVLALAKARVDTFRHIGFTDRLNEAMELMAAIVGRSLSSTANELVKPGWKPKCRNLKRDSNAHNGKQTVRDNFRSCMKQQRELTELNDKVAFNKFGDVEFSKPERKRIPEEVIEEIKRLNALDVELYEYAKEVYEEKLAQFQDDMESMENVSDKDCVA